MNIQNKNIKKMKIIMIKINDKNQKDLDSYFNNLQPEQTISTSISSPYKYPKKIIVKQNILI